MESKEIDVMKQQGRLSDDLFENKEQLKDFICPVCLGIISLEGAIQDNCNHLYCGGCSKKLEKCAISRQPITQRTQVPLPLKNFLGEQIMKCEYFEKGCQWKGKYENYYHHSEKECQFSDIEKKCQICQKFMKLKDFDQHLIEQRLEHYEIMTKKHSKLLDEEILYKPVKTSIHPHYLEFHGVKEKNWYCDAITDSPDKNCQSGHKGSSYGHQGIAKLLFICPSCDNSYCLKCVQKYKIN